MSFNVSSDWKANIQSLFETDTNRYVKNVNAYLLSGSSTKITGSSVSLKVLDANNTQQYLLTQATTPPVVLNSGTNVYYVAEVDVTAFPDGATHFVWDIEYSGSSYVLSSSLSLNPSPSVIIANGETSTLQDYGVNLDSAKTYSIKLMDAIGNPYDASGGVRLVFWDSLNGSRIASPSGSLSAQGSGFYQATYTLSSSNFVADAQRYQIFWEASIGSGFTEVQNSRQVIQVYGANPTVFSAPITYSTNDDLRKNIIGINKLLSNATYEHGEIEIMLNNKRRQASLIINRAIQANPRVLSARDLLQSWEMHEVHLSCLLDNQAFAKQASNAQLIGHIKNKIFEIKATIFGTIRSLRVDL